MIAIGPKKKEIKVQMEKGNKSTNRKGKRRETKVQIEKGNKIPNRKGK